MNYFHFLKHATLLLMLCFTVTTNAQEQTTLRVIHYEGADYFEDLNKAFEAANPDIKVSYDSVATKDYNQFLNSRLTTGEVDVVGLLEGATKAPDIAPRMLDLTGQAFLTDFYESGLEQAQDVMGTQIGLPLSVVGVNVFYNKQMFADLGLSVPTTWSEFVVLCETIKEAGIDPIALGGKDQWPINMVMLGLELGAVRGEDPEFWTKLHTEQASFADSLWVDGVFGKLQTLSGFFERNATGLAYAQSAGLFATGRTAMTIDGSWRTKDITDAGPAFEVGVFLVPGSDDATKNTVAPTKIGGSLAVFKDSQNQEAALRYLEFFSQPENYTLYLEQAKLLPARKDITVSDSLSNDIVRLFENQQPLFEVLRVPGATYDWTPIAMDILLGDKTPQQGGEELQASFIASKPNWVASE
jgi:raffinose/stachyose/melibiose transport system substrate-binding protein